MKRYDNKVVLVTGGTSGIGRATALAFGAEGAFVIIAARRENLGQEVVAAIEANGGKAVFIRTDIRVPAQIDRLFQEIESRCGRLDCAFNNAGLSSFGMPPAAKITEEEWDDILNTNLRGTWLCMKHEISQMLKQGGGVIVNTASVLGLTGEYGLASYCASKHGIIGLTKTAALEYAHKNIRVNAVCPGPIRTEMMEAPMAHYPKMKDLLLAKTPMRRMAEPEEIAGAVLWLASAESSFMTGKELVVAGGQGVAS
ncbi:MAG: glucose 1-dehydrogenase [Deltaproteobacteria bacterium]|nr:glucose 1-dehydrogenase [Deltaproteobacteria bacterium]